MTGGYTKLFSDILTSSIWNEDTKTRILWITMLAMSDATGFVRTSKGSLSVMARLSPEDVNNGLSVLESPDADSRSSKYDGRRLEKIEGGWQILNYEFYRNRLSDDPEAIKARERKRKQREKQTDDTDSRDVTGRHGTSCDSASASVDASVSKEEGCGEKKHAFGEFNNVKLTEGELSALIKIHGNANVYAGIEVLSAYMESKGKRYKNHYACLNRASWVWVRMKENGTYKSAVTKTENEW